MNSANFDRDSSWQASLASWGGLVLAGTLFSLVTLTPRLAELQGLKIRFAENQERLVQLEAQAEELARVANALQSDPQFVTELAKLEFSGTRRDAESIPVRTALRLGEGRAVTTAATATTSIASKACTIASLEWLASRPRLRGLLLAGSLALALVSLVGVREEQLAAACRLLGTLRRALTRIGARYQRESTDADSAAATSQLRAGAGVMRNKRRHL